MSSILPRIRGVSPVISGSGASFVGREFPTCSRPALLVRKQSRTTRVGLDHSVFLPDNRFAHPVINLLINVDHVGTLRNAREETFPDPVHAAARCEQAGADGIVFHLREDRRHVTERDVQLLSETVQGKLDFELSTEAEAVSICCDVAPELATLVPERREEVTTEGGLDVTAHRQRLGTVTDRLYDAGVDQISFFVDPVPAHIEAAAELGANCVELHTGDFAEAPTEAARREEAERLATGAEAAHEAGLRVHAGHGLNYRNFPLFRDVVPHVAEVSIGFAVMARAILVGMDQAVRDMQATVRNAQP